MHLATHVVMPVDQASEAEDSGTEDHVPSADSPPEAEGVAPVEAESAGDDSGEEMSWWRQRPKIWQATSVVVTFACAASLAFVVRIHQESPSLLPSSTKQQRPPGPLTVRSLLEGSELTELATDNLMAIGKDSIDHMKRDTLRGHVARSFQDISMSIQEADPEAHRRLGELELNEDDKTSVLHVLRHFGSSRMVSLTQDIVDAARQAKHEGGNHEVLQRHLSEKLVPRVSEMRQLSEDLFPGNKVKVGVQALPVMRDFSKWHPWVQVDLTEYTPEVDSRTMNATFSRRLSFGTIAGVKAQAGTLFRALETKLGDKMPKAPSRLLLSPFRKDGMSTSSRGSMTFDGHQSFVQCVEKAFPDPMQVCECFTSHLESVIKMMVAFVKERR